MIVFLNGEFLPEEQARISVFDRGFLYGDGLFETLRVFHGRIFRWTPHIDRLWDGLNASSIPVQCRPAELRSYAETLIEKNAMTDAILRINVSRGVGPRGYSPRDARDPTVVMSLHPMPPQPSGWALIQSRTKLPPLTSLSSFKTVNRLQNVLAKAEADEREADEALLESADGFIGQGSASNIFWLEGRRLCTPSIDCGILPGVTRATVMELCGSVKEGRFAPEVLYEAEGIFLTLSSFGIVAVSTYEGHRVNQSRLVREIQARYEKSLERESGA
jgi:branched-chain amino acid aminotransferase